MRVDQQVYRGDVFWTPTDKLSFRFNYQDDKSQFLEPRVQDIMARTYDDPNPNWTKSIIGLPEMYTYVGTDYRGNPVEPFFDPGQSSRGLSRAAKSASGRTARAPRCRTTTTRISRRSTSAGS